MTHIQNPDVSHELSDVNTKPIYKFGFWMIVIVVGTAVLMWLFYTTLASREAKNDPAKPVIPNTASKLPPEPRLQLAPGHEVHPLNEMAEMHAQQTAWLNGYGWMDKNAGTARIPIAEAKRLLLAKGLPVGRQMTAQMDSTGLAKPDSATAASPKPAQELPGDDTKYSRPVPSGQSGGHFNEWHR